MPARERHGQVLDSRIKLRKEKKVDLISYLIEHYTLVSKCMIHNLLLEEAQQLIIIEYGS